MNVVKSAPECENLGDIRQGIDDLDRQIVQILARRLTYVKAATRFKASQQAIPAP
ncbi:isochorismate-pyruvate lyase, partial [Pseudomonas syringae pv. actinidiae ICMP 19096]